MRRPGRATGPSARLLFCGVALQILLVVLCGAASADGPHGAAAHSTDSNLTDERYEMTDDGLMVRHGAAERNVQTKLRDEETEKIVVEDNDITHGTLPPAPGERALAWRGGAGVSEVIIARRGSCVRARSTHGRACARGAGAGCCAAQRSGRHGGVCCAGFG